MAIKTGIMVGKISDIIFKSAGEVIEICMNRKILQHKKNIAIVVLSDDFEENLSYKALTTKGPPTPNVPWIKVPSINNFSRKILGN